MATIELAVLVGVGARKHYASESSSEEEWLAGMRTAMQDIEAGLGKVNSESDKEYYRMKIASILLARALRHQHNLEWDSSAFEENFSHLLHLVPVWGFQTIFMAVYQPCLLKEFTALLLAMKPDVQKLMMDKMSEWLFGNDGGTVECEPTFSCKFCPLSSMVIVASVYVNAILLPTFAERATIYDGISNILERLSQNLIDSRPFHQNCELCRNYCIPTIERLGAIIAKKKEAYSPRPLQNVDIFHLSDISHVLAGNVVSNLGTSKSAAHLMEKLPRIAPKTTHAGTNVLPSDQTIDKCHQLLKSCLDTVETSLAASESHVAVCARLRSVLTILDQMCTMSLKDTPGEKKRGPFSSLEVIEHRLQGFQKTAMEIIDKIAENPLEKGWVEYFVIFQKNPECLARSEILLSIVKALSICSGIKEKIEEHITVSLSLQEMFWSGFELLPLKSKMELVITIMTDSKLVPLISEYPFSDRNVDQKRLNFFKIKRAKMLQTAFSGLVGAEHANKQILHRMSAMSLRWPEGTIQKIVDQIMKSQHQTGLFIDILKTFDYLLEFKAGVSKNSLFFEHFHKGMLSWWQNGESDSVGNGLNFLDKLVNHDIAFDKESCQSFLKEIFFKSITTSLNQEVVYVKETIPVLPELLGLKILSCVIGANLLLECVDLHEFLAFCVCLGASIDRSCHFWESNSKFNPEAHELLIECLEYAISKVASKLSLMNGTPSFTSTLEWTVHMTSAFKWTTQLRFLPIMKLSDACKVAVPSSLSEICRTPDIFHCSDDLTYGPGTGLVAWHQCFVVNPSLCPLSSLDIDDLPHEGTVLFSNGWIITLAQVLPFCLPHEWHTSLEATKVLLADHRLHVPYDTAFMKIVPIVNWNQCYVVLGVTKILHRLTEILAKDCCIHWTSSQMWLHVSKCYCMAIARLVSDSAEFDVASTDAKLFMLSQMFCTACGYMVLLGALPKKKAHQSCSETVFVLLLDLLGTYEKIWFATGWHDSGDGVDISPGKPPVANDELESPNVSSSGESFMSNAPSFTVNRTKLMLEVSEQLRIMIQMVASIHTTAHRLGLSSKLSKLLETLNK